MTSLQSGLVGGTLAPLVGEQPQVPAGGQEPPFEPNVPCETQPAITDLSTPSAKAPPQYPVTGLLPTGLLSSLTGATPGLPWV